MAGAVANLMVRAGADFSRLESSMQSTSRQVGEFHNGIKASFGRIGEILAAFGIQASIEKVADGIKEFVKSGIEYNATLEQSTVAWTTLLGTQDKAKQMLNDISNFAKATPFQTEQVNQMALYLHNAGLEGKNMFDQLMKVSDVASAFNIPIDSAEELTRQMSQVIQSHVAYTEDLNILQDRGVPIYKAIADQLHTTVANVRKLASEGKISSDVYIQAFNNVANSVKGASDKQSQTFNGMLSTISDNLKIITGTLMQGAFEYLKGTLDKVMPILDRFSSTLKDKGLKTAIGEIVGKEQTEKLFAMFNTIKTQGTEAFNLFKSGIKFVIDNFNTLEPIMELAIATIAGFKIAQTIIKVYETWMAITKLMTAAQAALNLMLDANPIGVVILLVGGLVAALVYLYNNSETVRNKMNVMWMEIKGAAADSINFVIGKIDDLIGLINKIPGVNIPIIPKIDYSSVRAAPGTAARLNNVGQRISAYASGTDFASGGLSLVGEEGPELVDLPRGSKVHTASETNKMLGGTQKTYNVTVNSLQASMDEKDLVRALQRMEALNYA